MYDCKHVVTTVEDCKDLDAVETGCENGVLVANISLHREALVFLHI